MAAADLTVRNGVGVDAEAVLRPLDWRSSLRTRAATRRPLAGVASLTESLVVAPVAALRHMLNIIGEEQFHCFDAFTVSGLHQHASRCGL